MQEQERVALVGVDWGNGKHAFALRGQDGRRWEGEFAATPQAVHEWVGTLRTAYPEGRVAVAVEQARGALIYALMQYEFLDILPVHPERTAGYRVVARPSGAKTDSIDADLVCDFADKHGDKVQAWRPADPLNRELQILVEWRRKLVDQRTATTNQLRDVLKQYFPQALEWIGERIDVPMALDFLERWPTLEQIKRSRPATIRTFYTWHHSRSDKRIDERLATIVTAVPLHRDPALISALSSVALSLVALVRTIGEQVHELDQHIARLWRTSPDYAVFNSLPGAGAVFAPRLAVALGTDRSRWTAQTLATFSGIAPLTVSSGQSKWVHVRWKCPKFLRQTFHEFAGLSLAHCKWAAAFYQQQRSRGAGHHQAIRSLAFRWIRIIVRCWKDRVPYDDERYTKRLIDAGSPIAAALAA